MLNTRRQLTLFVPSGAASQLEAARQVLDPAQFKLIRAHVTLCRDDEIGELSCDRLTARASTATPITLAFGRPEKFSGHGVLLPCIAGQASFHDLRCHLLESPSARPRQAHITLAHPRNPQALGNTPENMAAIEGDFSISFAVATLIRQVQGGPWVDEQSFEFMR